VEIKGRPTEASSEPAGSGPIARLNNEFALVELEADHSANGVRLKIRSVRTGRVAYLDPLQLEVLTWLPVEEYVRHLETPFGPDEDEDLSIFSEMGRPPGSGGEAR
jgi:hypothetical protein